MNYVQTLVKQRQKYVEETGRTPKECVVPLHEWDNFRSDVRDSTLGAMKIPSAWVYARWLGKLRFMGMDVYIGRYK